MQLLVLLKIANKRKIALDYEDSSTIDCSAVLIFTMIQDKKTLNTFTHPKEKPYNEILDFKDSDNNDG